MESHDSELPTEIEKLWITLSSEDQKKLLQKFVEVNKKHVSPSSSVCTRENHEENHEKNCVNKRVLNSPETPNKEQSRKVLSINKRRSSC